MFHLACFSSGVIFPVTPFFRVVPGLKESYQFPMSWLCQEENRLRWCGCSFGKPKDLVKESGFTAPEHPDDGCCFLLYRPGQRKFLKIKFDWMRWFWPVCVWWCFWRSEGEVHRPRGGRRRQTDMDKNEKPCASREWSSWEYRLTVKSISVCFDVVSISGVIAWK